MMKDRRNSKNNTSHLFKRYVWLVDTVKIGFRHVSGYALSKSVRFRTLTVRKRTLLKMLKSALD